MHNLGVCFILEPVDPKILSLLESKYITYTNKELFKEEKILSSPYADTGLINDLFKAKQYLHDN